MDTSSGTSSSTVKNMDVEEELTNKFLSGEMSFAEYSNEWYNYEEEDADDDNDNAWKRDLESRQSVQTAGKKKRTRTSKFSLTTALLGLMGEANLRFVRGDKEMAERMCHEIIKQIPTAPEPYQTLAQIYENDAEKSLQFSLLAAHLSSPDSHEWLRLAAISKEKNDVKQQMICYTQAIKADPHNLDLHMKRIDLLTALEETKFPISSLNITRVKCYHKIVNSLPVGQSETILKYAKMAATIYHNNQEVEKALEVMTAAYKKCSSNFTVADINIYLELLIARKQYQTCIDVFIAKMGVDIEAEIQTIKNDEGDIEEQTNYLNCSIPNNLPIDLKSKLLICFIHLGAVSLVQTLLNDFLSNDVGKAGDLYMDIEEALSSVGEHKLAMQVLEPLLKNPSFNLAAVWLKHAECMNHLGREDDAVQSYYKVLNDAPQHGHARQKLFNILEKQGRIDEALNILQQDYKYEVSAALLHEQCCALKKYNKMEKYLEVGEALLSKTFTKYRHPEELKIAFVTKATIDMIHNFRITRGENPYHEDEIHFDEEETFKLTAEEEWEFFKELLSLAHKYKQYFTMQRLSFGAIMSKNLPSSHRLQIEFYCLQACLLAKDYKNAFRLVREHNAKYPTIRSLNLLNHVLHVVDHNSHIKFLTRLFQKEPYSVVKKLFLGNNFLISGRYIVALKYYLEYHDQYREPLSALLIAISMLVMAAQRTVDKHHSLVLQGMCYLLTYKSLRKCDQETNYNLGRAYQMLSIDNLAIEYYERVLLSRDPITVCPQHGVMDLTRETAYNLYILYKNHSPNLARKYMLDYLVIE